MAGPAMMDYPKKPRFYANRFVRLMAKACVAQDVGPEAFTLLTVVVMTEDARHYRSPVTFFNEQIAPMCGFVNVKALDRARRKACESGWLQYQPGGKGIPGKYFVTIPEAFGRADDGPSDEGFPPVSLVDFDQANGREAGEKRERSGQHSYLSLSLSQEGGAQPPTESEIIDRLSHRFKSEQTGAPMRLAEIRKTIRELIVAKIPPQVIAAEIDRADRVHSEFPRVMAERLRAAAKKPAEKTADDILKEMQRRREES